MGKVIFIGNYPPPFSGQSIAFKTLVDSYSIEYKDYYIINTIEKIGKRGNVYRMLDYISVIFRLLYLLLFKKTETIYHIVSSNKKGFIRDYVIINLSYLFGKKIILHSHNGNYDQFFDLSSKRIQKTIYKTICKASTIILLSKKLRKTFYFISEDDKFAYVNNGLPIERPKVLNKFREGVFSILFLSNLIESKGYLDIIKAAAIMKQMKILSKFHFHFAGDFMLNPSQDKSYNTINEARQLFSNLIEENNLSGYITYHGIVQGEKKNILLQNADVFLLPTYYNVEAQPLTIIEAIAYGCAIFSTNYRGIPEMLIEGHNGQYVEPNSPSNIAEKLSSLNRVNILEYSKYSIDLFDKKFTKDQHTSNMLNLMGD
jgi:glycosyltransferase involved in cell wall biosynthesis